MFTSHYNAYDQFLSHPSYYSTIFSILLTHLTTKPFICVSSCAGCRKHTAHMFDETPWGIDGSSNLSVIRPMWSGDEGKKETAEKEWQKTVYNIELIFGGASWSAPLQSCTHYAVMCSVWLGINIILYTMFTYHSKLLVAGLSRKGKYCIAATSAGLLHCCKFLITCVTTLLPL